MAVALVSRLSSLAAIVAMLAAPLLLWLLAGRDSSILQGVHPSWLDYFAALVFVLASVTEYT